MRNPITLDKKKANEPSSNEFSKQIPNFIC